MSERDLQIEQKYVKVNFLDEVFVSFRCYAGLTFVDLGENRIIAAIRREIIIILVGIARDCSNQRKSPLSILGFSKSVRTAK